jgi:hypothetical protein
MFPRLADRGIALLIPDEILRQGTRPAPAYLPITTVDGLK